MDHNEVKEMFSKTLEEAQKLPCEHCSQTSWKYKGIFLNPSSLIIRIYYICNSCVTFDEKEKMLDAQHLLVEIPALRQENHSFLQKRI